jgi:hypothetical protein
MHPPRAPRRPYGPAAVPASSAAALRRPSCGSRSSGCSSAASRCGAIGRMSAAQCPSEGPGDGGGAGRFGLLAGPRADLLLRAAAAGLPRWALVQAGSPLFEPSSASRPSTARNAGLGAAAQPVAEAAAAASVRATCRRAPARPLPLPRTPGRRGTAAPTPPPSPLFTARRPSPAPTPCTTPAAAAAARAGATRPPAPAPLSQRAACAA